MQERLNGRRGRVGGDARLTSHMDWQAMFRAMQQLGLTLSHMPTLIDQLWTEEPDAARRRPEFSKIVANLHHVDYIGKT